MCVSGKCFRHCRRVSAGEVISDNFDTCVGGCAFQYFQRVCTGKVTFDVSDVRGLKPVNVLRPVCVFGKCL